jgi:hypothetical protein
MKDFPTAGAKISSKIIMSNKYILFENEREFTHELDQSSKSQLLYINFLSDMKFSKNVFYLILLYIKIFSPPE